MSRRGVLAALLLASAAGCSSASAEPEQEDPLGPPRAFVADDAIVAIISPRDATFVCSAEVIAPRTILSAAHCFRGGNYDKTGWTFELVVGVDAHHPARGDRRVAITGINLHPDYESQTLRPDGSDADIAVATVDDDLGVPPKPWNASSVPASLAGAQARYAGFGALDTAAKGTRHFEPARVEKVEAALVTMSSKTRNPCHGDSGGPLLVTIGGVETIVGVGHDAFGGDDAECELGADYTRVDLFAAFVREHLR